MLAIYITYAKAQQTLLLIIMRVPTIQKIIKKLKAMDFGSLYIS